MNRFQREAKALEVHFKHQWDNPPKPFNENFNPNRFALNNAVNHMVQITEHHSEKLQPWTNEQRMFFRRFALELVRHHVQTFSSTPVESFEYWVDCLQCGDPIADSYYIYLNQVHLKCNL